MQRNISNLERAVSVAAGSAIIAYAMTKSRRENLSPTAMTTATGLIARGLTGFCPVSAIVGRDTGRSNTRTALGGARGVHVHESITINRPAPELFRFWRDFANLPRFMDHLEDVEVRSPIRSVWTARAPAGMTVKWEAEIINEVEGELIGWQSTDNADVATAGSVRFVPVGGQVSNLSPTATEIIVRLQYEPPAGRLGSWVAWLFGEEPAQQIRADLTKLKALLEAGEAPRTDGPTAGRSSERLPGRPIGAPV